MNKEIRDAEFRVIGKDDKVKNGTFEVVNLNEKKTTIEIRNPFSIDMDKKSIKNILYLIGIIVILMIVNWIITTIL